MEEKNLQEMNTSNGDKKFVQTSDVELQFKKDKKCTSLEKGLGLLVFLALVAVVALAIIVATRSDDDSSSPPTGSSTMDRKLCTTRDCVSAASRLTESLDESVDPCDNFYDFSCGSWRKKTIITEDRSSINMFGVVRDDVEVTLKYLLEEQAKDGEPDAVRKAKDMYKSCMNEDLIEKLGTRVLTNLMKELGGWPMIGTFNGITWDSNAFNITKVLHALLKYNNRIFMDLYASTDTKNSSTRILYLDQSDFGMPGRSYYLADRNDSMIKAYEQLGISIAVGLGADPTTAADDMKKIVDLEIELANISIPNEERRDSEKLYNLMTLSDLPKNFTTANMSFDWFNYVQGALGAPLVQIDIPLDEPIIVRAPLYFERLFTTLSKYDRRTIANYMVWRIMQNRANNLGQKFKDIIQLYNEVVYGTATARARWRSCTSYVNTNLGLALGRLFVREAFEESAKNDTLEMINNLMASFTEILEDAQWMDDATRTVAREKAEHIQRKIGYQDDIMDDKILDEIYQNITISSDTYLENVLNVISIISADSFIFLREPVDKNVWSSAPATVNAYYSSVYNRIMFPAGILQPPFYSRGRSKSMNYGGIGVVIGHELTHGFDDRGRQFDKDGNLVQWWSNEVIDRFEKQTQCLVQQYGNFTMSEADNMKVNGINTLGENIADNGGLKESFRAYRTWVQKNGEEPKLPGVSYSHNQIFFISFAQVWCENIRKESAINRILTGVHSPGRFRVIGTLQNSRDFSEAFNCKRGSFMNPHKKCYVW